MKISVEYEKTEKILSADELAHIKSLEPVLRENLPRKFIHASVEWIHNTEVKTEVYLEIRTTKKYQGLLLAEFALKDIKEMTEADFQISLSNQSWEFDKRLQKRKDSGQNNNDA
jgi:hypothetical protein